MYDYSLKINGTADERHFTFALIGLSTAPCEGLDRLSLRFRIRSADHLALLRSKLRALRQVYPSAHIWDLIEDGETRALSFEILTDGQVTMEQLREAFLRAAACEPALQIAE